MAQGTPGLSREGNAPFSFLPLDKLRKMCYTYAMKKIRKAFTLSPETNTDLELLASDMRQTQTAVVELAIRVLKRVWETEIEPFVQVPDLPKQETD